MERVLAIPELLDLVCSNLEGSSLVLAAVVCKRWNAAALDAIWREIDDVRVLFRLLAPVLPHDRDDEDAGDLIGLRVVQYYFSRPLLPADWTRFEKYGRRVRKLRIDTVSVVDSSQYRDVFDEIARTRTSLNVLPNLRSLSWDIHLNHAVIFMHSNITEFSFPITSPAKYDILPYIDDIISRMPRLATIHLYPRVPAKQIQRIVLRLFEETNLPCLRKIVVPKHFTTTEIMESLSRLPTLKVLEFRYDLDDHSDASDVEQFEPVLMDKSFLLLDDLSLTVPLKTVVSMYERPNPPTNLTILYLHSYVDESPASMHALLVALSTSCKQLITLCILSSIRATSPERITYETLEPVLSFPGLLQFEIIHHNPVDISLSQLDDLASRWPHLESLVLGNEPFSVLDSLHSKASVEGALSLEAVYAIARHCPKITRLGLFVDGTAIPDNPPRTAPLDYGFTKPITLSMGMSMISSPGPVALYLSRLSQSPATSTTYPPPNLITLESGLSIDEVTNDPSVHILDDPSQRDSLRELYQKWISVNEFMPLLVQLRWEEQVRTKALRDEVDDLRMRNEVLSEMKNGKIQKGVDQLGALGLRRRISMLF